MSKGEYLGEFEQVVLLAVAWLGEGGYGATIRGEIERRTGRAVSLGAVYATLVRLEEKGLVTSWQGESTARRGGRAKRHYRLMPAAVKSLRASRRMLEGMWEGVELEARPRRA
jgi:DNA-binding PadR family transcriptional regulator